MVLQSTALPVEYTAVLFSTAGKPQRLIRYSGRVRTCREADGGLARVMERLDNLSLNRHNKITVRLMSPGAKQKIFRELEQSLQLIWFRVLFYDGPSP